MLPSVLDSPLPELTHDYIHSTVLEKQDESDAEKHARLANKQYDIPHYRKFTIITVAWCVPWILVDVKKDNQNISYL